MRTRPVLLLCIFMVSFVLAVYFLAKNTSKKICYNCDLRPPVTPPTIQNEGSSPDDLHYNSINRMLVSTIR